MFGGRFIFKCIYCRMPSLEYDPLHMCDVKRAYVASLSAIDDVKSWYEMNEEKYRILPIEVLIKPVSA